MSVQGLMIVDANPNYREALVGNLVTDFARQPLRIIGVGCAQEALDVLTHSDLRWTVVLDIQMPGLSGLASIKAFHALQSVQHVVCLSSLNPQLWEHRTVRAGASLFLSKNCDSSLISRKLTPLLCMDTEDGLQHSTPSPDTLAHFHLTTRQRDILNLIAQGHPNNQIAGLLEINEPTVKIHIHQIYKALRVFNRTQAIHRAQKLKLI